MSNEPLIKVALWVAALGGMVGAVFAVLTSFGLPVTATQAAAATALFAAVAAGLTAVAGRGKVQPITSPSGHAGSSRKDEEPSPPLCGAQVDVGDGEWLICAKRKGHPLGEVGHGGPITREIITEDPAKAAYVSERICGAHLYAKGKPDDGPIDFCEMSAGHSGACWKGRHQGAR